MPHSKTLARNFGAGEEKENTRMIGDLYVGDAPGIRLFFPASFRTRKSARALFCRSCVAGNLEMLKGARVVLFKNRP
jgi:hypothetical protein